jgi:hypothetical protein
MNVMDSAGFAPATPAFKADILYLSSSSDFTALTVHSLTNKVWLFVRLRLGIGSPTFSLLA